MELFVYVNIVNIVIYKIYYYSYVVKKVERYLVVEDYLVADKEE